MTGDRRRGARLLRRWFGEAVSEPVRLHVAAKRYLCATEMEYLATLLLASVPSLNVHGNPFSAPRPRLFSRRQTRRRPSPCGAGMSEPKMQRLVLPTCTTLLLRQGAAGDAEPVDRGVSLGTWQGAVDRVLKNLVTP